MTTLTVLTLLTAYLMTRKPARKTPVMLMIDPRQCLLGFRQISKAQSKANLEAFHSFTLPPLTKEDRL